MYSSANQLTQNIQELQMDILNEDTSLNPLFVYSKVATRTKALNTTAQTIVKAINEVLMRTSSINTDLNSALSRIMKLLGNTSDPVLATKVNERGNSIAEIVLELDDKLANLDLSSYSVQRDVFDVDENTVKTTFVLSQQVANISTIKFYVNGLLYENGTGTTMYSYNENLNTVYWVSDLFSIKDAVVIIEYEYKPVV